MSFPLQEKYSGMKSQLGHFDKCGTISKNIYQNGRIAECIKES